MSEKKQNILKVALQLFAKEGFNAVSTSRIAKEAGVSEGLIFRHFGNKKGLLDAIMEQGLEKASTYFFSMQDENPKVFLKGIIEMLFTMSEEDKIFWRLVYSLKWSADVYDNSMSEPIKLMVRAIFSKLDYKNVDEETEYFMALMDGVATSILLKKPDNQEELKELILKKYRL